MYFEVDEIKKEVTDHLTEGLPVAIYQRSLKKAQQDQLMPHWHEEFQFVWVISGALDYTIETQHVCLQQARGLLINSAKLHSAQPASATAAYLCINFSPFFINELFYQKTLAELRNNPNFIFAPIILHPQQEKILQELLRSSEINFLKLYELLLGLFTQINTEQLAFTKNEPVIYELLDYVHTNYQQPLTVDTIAQSIPLNKNKCTHLFKQYTTLSPINYLIDFRLNKAKELLQTTDLSVSEICYAVGFNNLSYFITTFKKKYRCTPLKFRQQF